MSTPRLKSVAEERRLLCCALVNNSVYEMEIRFSCLRITGCVWRYAVFKIFRKSEVNNRVMCKGKQR